MSVEIRLLGRFEVRVDGRVLPADGWGRRQAASLVKMLAVAPGQQLHRERLLDALWPGVPVDEAAPRLHKLAHYARRAFGDREGVVLRGEMALCPGRKVVVDAHVFTELAGRALAGGDPAAAATAVEAYGGDLLPEDLYEPWAEDLREHLRQRYLRLLRQAGRWDDVLAAEPADEDAHLALMRGYAGQGDRRAVLVHREAAQRLASLGASPARVGHHLSSAGDHAAAIPYLLRAAETEAAVGAYRDALRLVDSVRPHATGPEGARLRALRADLLVALGDPAAVPAYREVLEVVDSEAARALRGRLARAAVMSGDLDTAAAALDGLTPDGGRADAAILLAQGNLAYFRGDTEAAWAVAEQARRRILPGDTEWQLLDLITLQGLIAHNRGEWFERLRIELRQTRQAPGLATIVFDSHLCVAEYLLYGPTPYPEVISLARSLRGSAHRSGALRAVAFAAALTGEAALLAGDLELADTELQEAADLHREIGATAGESHSLQRLAEVRLARGDRAGAEAFLRRALPLARWSPIAPHLLQRIYGTMILAAAGVDAAWAAVDRAEATFGHDDQCLFCNVMLAVPAAIACADAGDIDRARRYLVTAERSAALWEGTAWQAATYEARAHVARADGDEARAGRLLTEAARLFENAGQPLDAARCRLGVTGQ